MYSNNDFLLMNRALSLAEKGMYITTPNPRVGCVLYKDNRVIGEGFTQPAGLDHAEIQALKDARKQGSDIHGASVYVTMEPCSHFGRTPACVDALIKARIKRVVAAMKDPNPQVSGNGLDILRASGIEVSCGLLEEKAYELNIGFVKRMMQGQPWVRMKIAASIDGRTALSDGNSHWITNLEARKDGHRWRARACAVLTGIGTVLIDDPHLTVRLVQTTRQPKRILIDSKLTVSPDAKIFSDSNVLVIHASYREKAIASKINNLRNKGIEVIALPDKNQKVDLKAVLELLGTREINELHLEAGSKLNSAWFKEKLIDELLVYLAPSVLGDKAISMFTLPKLHTLDTRMRFRFCDIEKVGDDLRLLLRPSFI